MVQALPLRILSKAGHKEEEFRTQVDTSNQRRSSSHSTTPVGRIRYVATPYQTDGLVRAAGRGN